MHWKLTLLFLMLLVTVPPTYAQDPGEGDYTLIPVATGLERPLYVLEVNDETGRLFILEQPGRVRIVENGTLLDEPFMDITDRTGVTANERGLLGMAFHPSFVQNGTFYLNYTDVDTGNTKIARYQVSADPNRADVSSEAILLEIEQPYGNHNGGMIAFGPDGYLYIGMGDGGSAGDPENHGQNPDTLLGAMLRIDVDSNDGYGIPSDNPFVDGDAGRPEIWAIGLRNPWRFSFDRTTGDMYIGDVGQNAYEEINFQPASSTGGENYGWNIYEGNHEYRGDGTGDFIFPIAEYGRDEGCSVTGGYVYRGEALPDLKGTYLYGDYCTGTIWWLQPEQTMVIGAIPESWNGGVFLETDIRLTSFGEDLTGELYVVDHRGGVYQLVAEE